VDQDFAPANFNLAVLLERMHRYQEARSHYTHAAELDPKAVGPHLNLALIAKNVDHDYAQAERHLRTAMELAPDDVRPFANLASLMQFQLNQPDEAIDLYRKAIAIDSTLAVLHVNIGTLMSAKPETCTEAEAHFITALSLQPDFIEAQVGLANLIALRGEVEEAMKMVNTLLHDNPTSDAAHHALAVLLSTYAKKYETAASHEREAIKINPANVEARYCLAVLLFERFLNDEEAADQLNQILLVQPQHPRACLLLDKVKAKIASEQSDIPDSHAVTVDAVTADTQVPGAGIIHDRRIVACLMSCLHL
jgi:tetratricopeptide (TPR) repeat protein